MAEGLETRTEYSTTDDSGDIEGRAIIEVQKVIYFDNLVVDVDAKKMVRSRIAPFKVM